MLIEKGLLNESKEKELLKGYDLNSLTDYQSVLDFDAIDTDLNSENLNKLSLLFGTYIVWPVTLWPLIDLIRNSSKSNQFIDVLWTKLNDVTYYKKFNQWPPDCKISEISNNKYSYNFDDPNTNDFGALLLSVWGKDFLKEINEKFLQIETDELKPEFPIPEDDEELKYFLGIEKLSEKQKREIRTELRDIAKEDSQEYVAL